MRMIDADALFKAIKKDKIAWRFGVPNTLKLLFDYLRIIIAEQPTIDAVPVVRCGECEKRDKKSDLTDTVYCMWFMEQMRKCDFCSYGEERCDDAT